jgi:hypothetical protein
MGVGGNKTTTRERPVRDQDWDFSGVGNGSGGEPPPKRRRLSWPPSRGLMVLAGAVVAIFLAAYVYDHSHRDLIRKGVQVAGVDVGGLRVDQARAKLRRQLGVRLQRPVTVAAAGDRFKLNSSQAGLTPDLDGMVDEALAESRSGGLPVRVFKDLGDQRSDANLPAQVDYSRAAVRRFVRDLKGKVDRPPRDASVAFETADLPVVPSQSGLKVNAPRLRSSVEGALGAVGGERAVRAKVRVTKPKVTSDDLAPKYPVVVTVNRSSFQLRLFKKLHLAKTYKIAVGQAGLETPAGLYHVQNKQVDPTWSVPNRDWAGDLAGTTVAGGAPDNPLKARWLGIFDGAGIHGTSDVGSLGSAASHGCIRMDVPDVIALYDQVPVGAPVYIS